MHLAKNTGAWKNSKMTRCVLKLLSTRAVFYLIIFTLFVIACGVTKLLSPTRSSLLRMRTGLRNSCLTVDRSFAKSLPLGHWQWLWKAIGGTHRINVDRCKGSVDSIDAALYMPSTSRKYLDAATNRSDTEHACLLDPMHTSQSVCQPAHTYT